MSASHGVKPTHTPHPTDEDPATAPQHPSDDDSHEPARRPIMSAHAIATLSAHLRDLPGTPPTATVEASLQQQSGIESTRAFHWSDSEVDDKLLAPVWHNEAKWNRLVAEHHARLEEALLVSRQEAEERAVSEAAAAAAAAAVAAAVAAAASAAAAAAATAAAHVHPVPLALAELSDATTSFASSPQIGLTSRAQPSPTQPSPARPIPSRPSKPSPDQTSSTHLSPARIPPAPKPKPNDSARPAHSCPNHTRKRKQKKQKKHMKFRHHTKHAAADPDGKGGFSVSSNESTKPPSHPAGPPCNGQPNPQQGHQEGKQPLKGLRRAFCILALFCPVVEGHSLATSPALPTLTQDSWGAWSTPLSQPITLFLLLLLLAGAALLVTITSATHVSPLHVPSPPPSPPVDVEAPGSAGGDASPGSISVRQIYNQTAKEQGDPPRLAGTPTGGSVRHHTGAQFEGQLLNQGRGDRSLGADVVDGRESPTRHPLGGAHHQQGGMAIVFAMG